MPVDLVKEYIKLNRFVLMTESQSVFESDILVPDIKPDISEVLVIDAFPSVESVENYKDKLTINIRVLYKILYKCEGGQNNIRSINYTAKYSASINADGLYNDSITNVKCDVEHIDYNLLNERKLNAKVIVKFKIKIVNMVEQGLACDIESSNPVEIKKKNHNISSCVFSSNEFIEISEILTLPGVKSSIEEILRSDAVILGKSVRLVDDKIVIKGELNVTTLYLAQDQAGSLQFVENTIPFTRTLDTDFLDVNFSEENTILDSDILLKSFDIAVSEDSDGENRCIDIEAIITVDIQCYENRCIAVLDDAFALNANLKIKRENCSVFEHIGETQNQFVLKEILKKPDDLPEIGEIINISCKPGVTDWNIEDGRIIVEGFVTNNVLYLSNNAENPVTCFASEIPFKHVFDRKNLDESVKISIKADVEHLNFSIVSTDEIETRIVINASTSIGKINEIPAISDIEEEPLDMNELRKKPGLILYFVKEGDTLWSIAKKYISTEEVIKTANGLDDNDILYPGQQLIVQRIALP